jgi:hypothetical protein
VGGRNKKGGTEKGLVGTIIQGGMSEGKNEAEPVHGL